MIKGSFTKNIWLKLASLILAILLWFFVILRGRSEIMISVPVVFTNIPSQLEVVDYPETVSINVEGQERLIKNLRQKEISAVVDVSEAKVGRSFFSLSSDNFNLPKTFIITSINPETISLKIEAQLKKTISVKPYVVGLPEKGFAIVEINVVPEKIELEGPKSVIAKIYNIKTEPIDINGINTDLKYKANLSLSNSNIRLNVSKVEVNIAVKKISNEKNK
jgi:YbbR domain-containing protein